MSSYPSFKSFLIVESDMESQSGQTFEINPSAPSQEFDADANAANNELDAATDQRVSLDPTSLDQDERFLELPQQERFRLKQLSYQSSPQELEDDLQQTWERIFGDKGVSIAPPDTEYPMGESLIAQLLHRSLRKN